MLEIQGQGGRWKGIFILELDKIRFERNKMEFQTLLEYGIKINSQNI